MYDCSKCPGFCCSIPVIPVTKDDIQNIANHFSISISDAKSYYVKELQGKQVLKHQSDSIYNSVCRLFCITTRRCTVYNARPKVCKDYPHGDRCSYYEIGSPIFPNLRPPAII